MLLASVGARAADAVDAGGVVLNGTRVIYPADSQQASLSLVNTTSHGTFLIQSWVEGADGQKSEDFIVTPPLFVMSPKKESILRLIYAGSPLPTDRETVFYLNVKAIPSSEKRRSQSSGGVLEIAIQNRIKVFYRPKKLLMSSDEARKHVSCALSGDRLIMTNTSPYYVSTLNLTVGGKNLPNTMVPPKDAVTVAMPQGTVGAVTFQAVNDYGVNTVKQVCDVSVPLNSAAVQ
ncbi:hypothetical protein VL15_37845 [Burkholderia cepacia]|uniref:Fimbrial chaperone protein n=2 Tax=Burkholderia cepacia TaxID=292 RepID=A0A0J5VYC3_BURCE|nr:hypothetical protein VL15_37845 [Burkholderia cepacia]